MTLTAFSLAGHTILITGASSGIGRTISIRASQMGARVVLLGRDMTRLDETLAMLDGKDHLSVSMDLLKLHEIESALTPLLKSTGPLKEEVNNTNSKADDFAGVARMVVKILKNDYGIQDEKKIMQVIKIIKEVLK